MDRSVLKMTKKVPGYLSSARRLKRSTGVSDSAMLIFNINITADQCNVFSNSDPKLKFVVGEGWAEDMSGLTRIEHLNT
jgi:hypothetical protein